MKRYEGQLKNYNWNITEVRNHHKKKKAKRVCNDIICFDTESTSAWIENGKVINYRKGESEDYWNSLEPISITYIWMVAVNDNVYYGRNEKSFLRFIKDLPDAECVIYVHNLGYDFGSFLINHLDFKDVFSRSPHKPIKATCSKYPNVTFKCSYALTNLSLENWGKNIGVEKKKGDLDYTSKLRTPKTKLTQKELGYCEYDVRVMVAGIRKYVERFGTLQNIPMTMTGIVRTEVKNRLCTPWYMKLIKKLIPYNANEYHLLQEVFSGGYTHANRWFSTDVIKIEDVGYIGHKDFASSYPTWSICAKVPCTPWTIIESIVPDLKDIETKAYIIDLEMWDVECLTYNTYIQRDKCSETEEAVWDNGRLVKAKRIRMKMLELDWYVIRKTYKMKKKKSHCTWTADKDFMPDDLRQYILELYEAKTKWKKVPGYEDMYNNSKADLNAVSFGMLCSAICYSEVEFNNGGWSIIPLTQDAVNEKLGKLKQYYAGDKRYFVSYSWGVYVCAYARTFGLWDCILSLDTPNGKNNVLYCDTDSIFYTGKQDFNWYNEMIDNRLREACEEGGLDFEMTRPKDKYGVPHPLGHFEDEPGETIVEFKSNGAKRYCMRLKEDNKLHLTVAGINKEAVSCLNDDLENFIDGFEFDKDSDDVHKLLHTYNPNQSEVVFPDGYKLNTQYGINLRPTGYTMKINDEYQKICDFVEMRAYDIMEENFISLRGGFECEEVLLQ